MSHKKVLVLPFQTIEPGIEVVLYLLNGHNADMWAEYSVEWFAVVLDVGYIPDLERDHVPHGADPLISPTSPSVVIIALKEYKFILCGYLLIYLCI